MRQRTGLLTPHQRPVLQLAAAGLTNHQIATQLHLSHNTIREHLKNINQQLGTTTRTGAVLYALTTGQLHDPDIHIPECVAARACPCRTPPTTWTNT